MVYPAIYEIWKWNFEMNKGHSPAGGWRPVDGERQTT
jgi:hypothetical protein